MFPIQPHDNGVPLSAAQCTVLYHAMRRDLSAFAATDADRRTGRALCQVGQPVPLAAGAALRISLSARILRQCWSCQNGMAQVGPVLEDITTLVEKLNFAIRHIGRIEASAQWIPWVFKDIKRRAEGRKLPDNFFETYRLYVSCYSSTDDIEYIAQYSTENVLMTGTDYGHVDMSVEIDALRTLEKNGKVRPELARKILYDNPARFYGIQ